jgi:hypothetical protein
MAASLRRYFYQGSSPRGCCDNLSFQHHSLHFSKLAAGDVLVRVQTGLKAASLYPVAILDLVRLAAAFRP